MQALILNAGSGGNTSMMRLYNGETVIHRQIRILSECGIKSFVVTTGPFAEQLEAEARMPEFKDLNIKFVFNPNYTSSDYIHSMYSACEYIRKNVLLLHGNLVFEKSLIKSLLNDTQPCLALVNKKKPLTEDGLKARLDMERITEVSRHIFDRGCYTFFPCYKLNHATIAAWLQRIKKLVEDGATDIYAEKALNELLADKSVTIKMLSCEGSYIEKITTAEDLGRVSALARLSDYNKRLVINEQSGLLRMNEILVKTGVRKPMLVCGRGFDQSPLPYLLEYWNLKPIIFNSFSLIPTYEEIVSGVELFHRESCDFIISFGSDNVIEAAKIIKLFSALDGNKKYYDQEWKYSPVAHLAIPTAVGYGAQATRYAAINIDGVTKLLTHDSLVPEFVILDVNLIRNIPDYEKKSGYLRAFCRCEESLWSLTATDKSRRLAEKALRMLLANGKSYFADNSLAAASKILEASELIGRTINISHPTTVYTMSRSLTEVFEIATGHAMALCLPLLLRYRASRVDSLQTAGFSSLILKSIDVEDKELLDKILEMQVKSIIKEAIAIICKVLKAKTLIDAAERIETIVRELELNEVLTANEVQLQGIVEHVNTDLLTNTSIPLSTSVIEEIFRQLVTVEEEEDLGDEMSNSTDESEDDADADIFGMYNKKKKATKASKKKKKKLTFKQRIKNKVKKTLNSMPTLKRLVYYLWRWFWFRYYRWKYGVDGKKVIFEAVSGTKYLGNPKAIYEEMINSGDFNDFSFVWSFSRRKNYSIVIGNELTKIVEKNSRKAIREYATSKYWISDMGLPFYMSPNKEQVWLNTWHGKPLKRIGCLEYGNKIKREANKKKFIKNGKRLSALLAPSPVFSNIMAESYGIYEKDRARKMFHAGYPRNDFLFKYTNEDCLRVKLSLGIPLDKKVILYAPTWRPYNRQGSKMFSGVFKNPINLYRLLDELGDEYVFLLRTHWVEASSLSNDLFSKSCINVTNIDDINELFIISDLLISDYSGAIFDYANLRRPIILYTYDQDIYSSSPGFNLSLEEVPAKIISNEDELAAAIKQSLMNFEFDAKYKEFLERYNTYDGAESAKQIVAAFIGKKSKTKSKIRAERRKQKKIKLNLVLNYIKSHLKIKLTNNDKILRSYRNKHIGKRCFLIGNGPSLTSNDLSALKDEICFGCNMLYKVFDNTEWRPTYYFATDGSVFSANMLKELATNLNEIPLFTDIKKIKKLHNTNIKKFVGVRRYVIEPYYVHSNIFEYSISSNATVMSFMLETAIYMGFKEIFLLGVDGSNPFKADNHFTAEYYSKDVNGFNHNHAGRKGFTLEGYGNYMLDRQIFAYSKIREYADSKGIKIYNATRGGFLEIFKRTDFDELIKGNNIK